MVAWTFPQPSLFALVFPMYSSVTWCFLPSYGKVRILQHPLFPLFPFNLLFLCDSSSGSVLTCPDAQCSQQTRSELLFPATCRASPWGCLRFPTRGHCCNPCVCSSRLSHLTQRHRDSTQVRHQKVILLSVCSPTASMTSSDSRPPPAPISVLSLPHSGAKSPPLPLRMSVVSQLLSLPSS